MIHFFDPSNEKIVAKAAGHRRRRPTSCSATSRTRSRSTARRRRARASCGSAREIDLGATALWTRVNALESPVGARRPHHARHRDRRPARRDHGPEGRGAVGHPLRRPAARPARGAARAWSGRSSSTRSSRPRWASTNVEEIAAASPRMQGMSFGPADLAASRRMKTTRVGGGHPGYRVLADPDRRTARRARAPSRTSGTTRSGAWSTPARRPAILPFYGPFGDIKRRRGLRGAVPRRVPDGLRRRLVAAPGADRHRQAGLLAPTRTRSRFARKVHRGDPRRPRRAHDRRQDAGRRHLEAVQGDGRPRRRCSPRRTRSWPRPTASSEAVARPRAADLRVAHARAAACSGSRRRSGSGRRRRRGS